MGKNDDPLITNWHALGVPRFHDSQNEDIFAFSEALAASNHLNVIIAQLIICYYCNYQLENSFDEKDVLATKLNKLYRVEAYLFLPVLLLWLLSGHQVGIWVLAPALIIRLFWVVKKRIGIDLRAPEPLDDTAFRTMLMMIMHGISSIVVGGRLYWPRVQLDMSHMDLVSEYSYIAAQGVSSIAFLIVWFCMPRFMFKLGSHFFGSGLASEQKKYD